MFWGWIVNEIHVTYKITVIHCTWAKDIRTLMQRARARVRAGSAVGFNSVHETAAAKLHGFVVLDFCKHCLLSVGFPLDCSGHGFSSCPRSSFAPPSPQHLPWLTRWVGKPVLSTWIAVYGAKNTIWNELNPPEQSWLRPCMLYGSNIYHIR